MSKGNPLYVIKWLEDLAGTVTHFNWEALGSTSLRGPSALDIIHAIIEQLPGLKFLRFIFPEADSVRLCYLSLGSDSLFNVLV
jgi:hypothetical protein